MGRYARLVYEPLMKQLFTLRGVIFFFTRPEQNEFMFWLLFYELPILPAGHKFTTFITWIIQVIPQVIARRQSGRCMMCLKTYLGFFDVLEVINQVVVWRTPIRIITWWKVISALSRRKSITICARIQLEPVFILTAPVVATRSFDCELIYSTLGTCSLERCPTWAKPLLIHTLIFCWVASRRAIWLGLNMCREDV